MSWGSAWPNAVARYTDESYIPVNKPEIIRMGFVCEACQAEFEPGTKSFAELFKLAGEALWLFKWLDIGYKTWCPKCKAAVEH